jgi:trehalose-6-phosphate synthase
MNNERRLVVVSNRLPFTLKRAGEEWQAKRSTGGLATAMGPLLEHLDRLVGRKYRP